MSGGVNQAVVLAGGKGTRLRPILPELPKVVAPVGGRPFIHYVLAKLHEEDVERVVVSTGYKGNEVERRCEDHDWSFELDFVREDTPKGTGGALAEVRSVLDPVPTYVLNGDSIIDWDGSVLARAHRKRGAIATVLLTSVSGRERFGAVQINAEGLITNFQEKSDHGRGLVNAGVYLLEPEFFSAISNPEPSKLSFEREVLPRWVGERLFGVVTESELIDIGTPDSFTAAQLCFYKENRALAPAVEAMAPAPRGLVLLDRDGTVIAEKDHLIDPEEVELVPGAGEAVHRLCVSGYVPIIVTNQSVVGRGKLTETGLSEIHETMIAKLARHGGSVGGVYYCPHLPEAGCSCRKPAPGLIYESVADFGVTLEECVLIGDKRTDLKAAERAGIRAIGVRTGYGEAEFSAGEDRWQVVDDLEGAVQILVN